MDENMDINNETQSGPDSSSNNVSKVLTLDDYKNKLSEMDKTNTELKETQEVLSQYSAKLDEVQKENLELKNEVNRLKSANQDLALHTSTKNESNDFDSILLKSFAGVQ